MRQIAQSYRTGKLELASVPSPNPGRGAALVETHASLISAGTERMLVDLAKKNLLEKARERPDLVAKVIDKAKREGILTAWETVQKKLDNPIPLGYSLAGRVLSVGSAVRSVARGDRVACAGAGFANHAEANAVPENLLVPIPDSVSDEEASFVTVGAIALHGVRLTKPTLGSVVAVIGLGLIGQMAVSLLRAHGCDVVGIDIDRGKVERARLRGAVAGAVSGQDDAVEVVRSVSRGYGADAVVITASAPTNEPLALAGELARDRAIVSVVGFLPLEVPRKTYYEKELQVVVSRSYGPGRYDTDYEERGKDYPIGYVRWSERRNLAAVLRAIERGDLEVKSLITHRFAFEDALSAYELITAEKPEPHLGVVLNYDKKGGEASRVTRAPAQGRETLGVAVIGAGAFATSVLLPALTNIAGVKVATTVSGRGLSARHAADKFGGDVDADFDAALSRSDVHCVLIATRHDRHADQAARALRAGKDVFVEKPAALDEEGLAALGEAVTQSGRRLMVGYNRRFAPYAERVREIFGARTSGLCMHARINAGHIPSGSWVTDPGEGGGRVVGEVCHFVDLLSFWADAPPTRVSAHAIGPRGAYDRADNLTIGLSFADGSIATLTYTAMGDPSLSKEHYELFCEGTVAVLDNWRTLSVTSRGKTKVTRGLRSDKGHQAELSSFITACKTGDQSPIPWPSIEAVTRTTFAIEMAWTQGATIDLTDV